jgi:hypothetical protein
VTAPTITVDIAEPETATVSGSGAFSIEVGLPEQFGVQVGLAGPTGPQGPTGPPGVVPFTVAATPPASPSIGDVWIDTT